jgi:cytidine deaminase
MLSGTVSPAALLTLARQARRLAYAPYSEFLVGAAILAADGTVFTGCNVENASYPLSICAERVALGTAVAAGHRRFSAVAVVGTGPEPTAPCGMCRQAIAEFAPAIPVYCAGDGDAVVITDMATLLPFRFSLPLQRLAAGPPGAPTPPVPPPGPGAGTNRSAPG